MMDAMMVNSAQDWQIALTLVAVGIIIIYVIWGLSNYGENN